MQHQSIKTHEKHIPPASVCEQLYHIENKTTHSVFYSQRMKSFVSLLAVMAYEYSDTNQLEHFNMIIGASIEAIESVANGFSVDEPNDFQERNLNRTKFVTSERMPRPRKTEACVQSKTQCRAAKARTRIRCTLLTSESNQLCHRHQDKEALDWPETTLPESKNETHSTTSSPVSASEATIQSNGDKSVSSSEHEPMAPTSLPLTQKPRQVLIYRDKYGILMWPDSSFVVLSVEEPKVVARRIIRSTDDITFEPLTKDDIKLCKREGIPYKILDSLQVDFEQDFSKKGVKGMIKYFKANKDFKCIVNRNQLLPQLNDNLHVFEPDKPLNVHATK